MTDIVRLMWKEYRVLRSFWLALAIFGLACDALIFIFVASPQERLPGFFAFASVLTAGFALGAGAMSFALEREEATREFLRFIPLTSSRIFISKILMAASGTVLLGLLLSAVSLKDVLDITARPSRPWFYDLFLGARDMTLMYSLLVVQAMGWSVFFSLRSARTLLAALLGALGAVSSIGLVHAAAEPDGLFGNHRLWLAPALHVATTVAIWSIDAWLGRRWLHDRRVVWRSASDATGRLAIYKRLLWQQWRRSPRMLAVVIALGVAVPLLIWPLFIPMTVLGFALLGTCTFLSDQEARQFRFFAERGVAPGPVWLSRQLFWLFWAVGLACVLLAAHELAAIFLRGLLPDENEARMLWDELGWIFEVGGLTVWIGLSYGAGQLCSTFFRSGVLAAALGVVLAGVLAGWLVLMHTLQIALWWSTAPLVIAMFAATWLRAEAWILERNGVRAWLPPVAVLAIPVLALLAGVPAYRVREIPDPVMPVETATAAAPSPEANLAASRLLRLCESFTFPRRDFLAALYHPTDAQPTGEELKWLTESREALDEMVAAIDKLPPDAIVSGGSPRSEIHWRQLAAILLRAGQMAESEGRIDDAWRRYRSVFRFAEFFRRGNAVLGEVMGDNFDEATAMQLLRWGAREGQSAESLRAAIDELRQSETQDGSLAAVMLQEYQTYLEIVDDVQANPEQWNKWAVLAARWAPWEFTRAKRLLAYLASLNLVEAHYVDAALKDSSAQIPVVSQDGYVANARRLWQTTLLESFVEIWPVAATRRSAVCYRRAAQLALAAEAWRLEHDALPEKLAHLQSVYFDELPVDPFNNQAFTWLPWGLRAAVQSRNAGEIPAGTPLIYSAGINERSHGSYSPLPGDDTPLIYSAGIDERGWLEGMRRKSADEPIVRQETPSLGSGGSAAPNGGQGMPMAPPIAGGVAVPAPGPPTPAGAEPEEFLEGLAFPVGWQLPSKD